jgi:hypothetical protein
MYTELGSDNFADLAEQLGVGEFMNLTDGVTIEEINQLIGDVGLEETLAFLGDGDIGEIISAIDEVGVEEIGDLIEEFGGEEINELVETLGVDGLEQAIASGTVGDILDGGDPVDIATEVATEALANSGFGHGCFGDDTVFAGTITGPFIPCFCSWNGFTIGGVYRSPLDTDEWEYIGNLFFNIWQSCPHERYKYFPGRKTLGMHNEQAGVSCIAAFPIPLPPFFVCIPIPHTSEIVRIGAE